MSIRIIITCIIAAVFAGIVVADDPNEWNYKPGELIVRFAPKENGKQKSKAERKAILDSIDGGEIKHSFKYVPGLTIIKLKDKDKVKDKIKVFKSKKGILYAEPNYKGMIISTFPNDTYFEDLWGMYNTGQSGGTENADIDAPQAWGIRTDASDIIVAVIDTGVDYNHEDLAGNMWVNGDEIAGNGIDDDENGYVDDIYGYDFCTYGQSRDSDPDDDNGHGTHCAGTVGAVGNNNKGVVGVCWNVKIMALKWISSGGPGYVGDAIECIEYAIDMGANVLSNSWKSFGEEFQALEDEIQAANEAGVLFVAAAGNRGTYSTRYPAKYDLDNIVSVMSTDHNDNKSSFSEYHDEWVDLAAPGTNIYSCKPGDDYQYMNGTSMATPHVAGACALVWANDPNMTHLEVKEAVLGSVDKLSSLNNLCVTEGRLNLYNALTYKPPRITIAKTDNIDPNEVCGVDPSSDDPNDYKIVYTIEYGNPVTDVNDPNYIGTAYNVEMVDYLPDETEPLNVAVTGGGSYSWLTNTVTWDIGALEPGDSNTVTVTIFVMNTAVPLGVVTNEVEIENDEYRNTATEETPVCCFGGDVIYVDVYANGYNTGTSWAGAYTDLQDALARAAEDCGSEIWVAKGIYYPGDSSTDTFELLDSVGLYGGFKGNETARTQRNHLTNKTYLSGDIGATESAKIVYANDLSNADVLDGFIITSGDDGIYCDNSDLTITNCVITNNSDNGIYCTNSDIDLSWSVIQNNSGDGIHHETTGKTLTTTNSMIYKNNQNGIYTRYSTPTITNCVIHHNGSADDDYYGIHLYRPADDPYIRNNTIVYNTNEGIYFEDNDGDTPDVINCIIWNNHTADPDDQLYGTMNTTYNCINRYGSDPNDNPTLPDNDGNIGADPGFAYSDHSFGNFHLDPNSPCVNKGNPSGSYLNEQDIDAEDRVYDDDVDRVDMGADEVSCTDVYNDLDFNADGVINLKEFALFHPAWLSHDPNDTNFNGDPNDLIGWDARCNLNDDYDIDLADLDMFCEEWLWTACWRSSQSVFMMQSSQSSSMMSMPMSAMSLPAPAPIPVIPEPTIAEQIQEMEDSIEVLELISEDEYFFDEVDYDQWLDFMDAVYDDLERLEKLLKSQ